MGAVLAAIAQFAPLFIEYGVPFVEQLYKMFSNPTGPVQADWDALKQLTNTNARQQMLTVLAANGIDPTSPAGVAFLALTPA